MLPWMAGTVSTLKRGCQRVSLSSGTSMAGTTEDKKVCREAAGGRLLARAANQSSSVQVNGATEATSVQRVAWF